MSKLERGFSVEEALQFLDKISIAYADTPEVYDKFLDIMKNCKDRTIQSDEVIIQVKALFSDKQELFSDFTKFMPDDGQSTKEADTASVANEQHRVASPSVAPTKDEAWKYSKKVHERFSAEPHVYSSFVAVMNAHRIHGSVSEVLQQVSQLFAGHADLLSEFIYFLPRDAQDQARQMMHEAVKGAERHQQHRKPAAAHSPPFTSSAATSATVTSSSGTLCTAAESNVFVPTIPDLLGLQLPVAPAAGDAAAVATVSPSAAPGSKVRGNGAGRKRSNSTGNTSAKASPAKKTIVTRGSSTTNDEYFSPVPEVIAAEPVVLTVLTPASSQPRQPVQRAPPAARAADRPSRRKSSAPGTSARTDHVKNPGTGTDAATVSPSTHKDAETRLSQLEATVEALAREIAQLKAIVSARACC